MTKEDIRELTKQCDLPKILEWLEDLSEGRERQVIQALIVEKKKLIKQQQQQTSGVSLLTGMRSAPAAPEEEEDHRRHMDVKVDNVVDLDDGDTGSRDYSHNDEGEKMIAVLDGLKLLD